MEIKYAPRNFLIHFQCCRTGECISVDFPICVWLYSKIWYLIDSCMTAHLNILTHTHTQKVTLKCCDEIDWVQRIVLPELIECILWWMQYPSVNFSSSAKSPTAMLYIFAFFCRVHFVRFRLSLGANSHRRTASMCIAYAYQVILTSL